MAKEILRLVLTPKQKEQLEFIKRCREERTQQFEDDYNEELSRREEDESEAHGLTNEERNR